MTPKNTSCKFEITNILIAPEVFNNLVEVKDCQCESLLFYDHYSELPLLFICPVCGRLYMCECQKKYYDIIHNYTKSYDLKNYTWHYPGNNIDLDFEYFYRKSTYKPDICFICKNQIPDENYSYSGITMFGRRYESYIQARIRAYYNGTPYNPDMSLKDSYEDYRNVKKKTENEIRALVGYPLIGEKWINETTLYKICCILFDDCDVIREYSPKWLNKKRIDIYIEKYKLGIEYQGEQHFIAINRFGGEEGLQKTQNRDREKAKLCKENGVQLVYFNFDEELTEENVIKKLNRYIKK